MGRVGGAVKPRPGEAWGEPVQGLFAESPHPSRPRYLSGQILVWNSAGQGSPRLPAALPQGCQTECLQVLPGQHPFPPMGSQALMCPPASVGEGGDSPSQQQCDLRTVVFVASFFPGRGVRGLAGLCPEDQDDRHAAAVPPLLVAVCSPGGQLCTGVTGDTLRHGAC